MSISFRNFAKKIEKMLKFDICKNKFHLRYLKGAKVFCRVWSNSRNTIPAKYSSLRKFLPAKKSRKATILWFFHPWKTQIEIWFKQSESWSSRYIGWSSTIIFLATSFFDLGFCSISRLQRLAVSHQQK